MFINVFNYVDIRRDCESALSAIARRNNIEVFEVNLINHIIIAKIISTIRPCCTIITY